MNRRNLTLITASLGVLASVGTATAQGTMGKRASVFDVGIYGGGAYTTDWFASRTVSSTGGVITEAGEGDGHRIGLAPVFGANATFYGLPWFGVRLHYGYMPSDLPESSNSTGTNTGDSGSIVNNHLYDLSLLFRLPGLPVFSSLVGDLYGWVGGGGLSTDVAGEGACVPSLLAEGACLSRNPSQASVGQGVVGLGGDLVSLSSNVGIFAELAAHIYDSPVHVGDGFVPRVTVRPGVPVRVADDRVAVTPRLVAGLKFAFGGAPAIVPVAVAAPPPPPPPPPPPAPAAPAMRQMTMCVVQNGQLQNVTAMVNAAGTDTTVAGQRFGMAYPASAPSYASGAEWFVQSDNMSFSNQQYVRFGVTRVITPTTQLTRAGEVNGTPVFAEAGATAPYRVLYVPVRPGCEFQPYEQRTTLAPRG